VAGKWEPIAAAGNYAFNDARVMMAFVAPGRARSADAVLEAQRAAMRKANDNSLFTREVGHAVTKAIKDFGDGNYAETCGSCGWCATSPTASAAAMPSATSST
jgi:hypothetical protein